MFIFDGGVWERWEKMTTIINNNHEIKPRATLSFAALQKNVVCKTEKLRITRY